MATIIRKLWLAPVLALGLVTRGAAQEAVPTGKILILANDRVLEGEIQRLGDQYRIRRGMGETLVAASRAKRLCADWDDALAYQHSQANLGDPDERVRLARWCQSHGLKEQALAEARAALEMRPNHAETKQLVNALQRSPVSAAAGNTPTPASRVVDAPPALDLSADSLTSFNAKVQPILMNACANCHANGQGGSFQLLRAHEGGSRFTTQRNLTATVLQLKFDHLAASPLLVKAVSAHGPATQPPLKDRRSVPFQVLQYWAELVAVNNPHLIERRVAAEPAPSQGTVASVAASPTPRNTTFFASPTVSPPVMRFDAKDLSSGLVNAQQVLRAQQSPLMTGGAPRSETTSAPNPRDLFDPATFNARK